MKLKALYIYSQSRNLLFIADVQLKMGDKEAAINSLNQAAQLAATINYAPLQNLAQARIAKISLPHLNILQSWVIFAVCFVVGLIAFLLWRL